MRRYVWLGQKSVQSVDLQESLTGCEDCGFCILEINPIYGFVYVLSNPAFPTYLKVGLLAI